MDGLLMKKLTEMSNWQQQQELLVREAHSRQALVLKEAAARVEGLKDRGHQEVDRRLEDMPVGGSMGGMALSLHPLERGSNSVGVETETRMATVGDEKRLSKKVSPEHRLSPVIEVEDNNAYSPPPIGFRKMVDIENSPLKPGIDGRNIKTFEEFLDKNLSLHLYPEGQEAKVNQKRPFLKRGQGLTRFRPSSKPAPKIVANPVPVPRQFTQRLQSARNIVTKSTRPQQRVPESFEKRNLSRKTMKLEETRGSKSQPSARNVNVPSKRNIEIMSKALKPSHSKVVPHVVREPAPEQRTSVEPNASFWDLLEESSDGQDASTVSALEKLLGVVKDRKDKLMKKKSVGSHAESSWDDDSDGEQLNTPSPSPVKGQAMGQKKKGKKKVRWSKQGSSPIKFSTKSSTLQKPTASLYSSNLLTQIGNLEERLKSLQTRCSQKNVGVVPETDEQRLQNSSESGLGKEVGELKQQLLSLTNRLKTMEISTSAIQIPAEPNKSIKTLQRSRVERNNDFQVLSPRGDRMSINTSQKDEASVVFSNGDEMKMLKDNTVIYMYANGTTQTTYSTGNKLIEFPNGQIERIHPNGLKHITYPNNSQRVVSPDGSEECTTSDGTIVRISNDGNEVVDLPNGEREIRTSEYRRREYRNGTIKTVYADGSQETRYPNGRLRIKDKEGNLIVDSLIRCLNQLQPSS